MFMAIAGLLNRQEVDAIREAAERIPFQDGRATAGRFAREVKANEQAKRSDELDGVLTKVESALMKHPLFRSAARPRRVLSLLLSRYRSGHAYGAHVDDAIMSGGRSDLSFTLFLSDEDSYEGGALVVQEALEDRSVRLAPGDLIVYPSNTLHRVEEVTTGERLAVVGWATSWVRQPERREVLFDLDQSINELHESSGKTPLFDRLTKTRSNLLRMWADA